MQPVPQQPLATSTAAAHSRQRVWPGLAVFALLALLLGWRLSGPDMQWDEGWTLSVARQFAERGHYGRLLLGEPVAGGLQASFWVVGPIALIFQAFGVGVWQGRLYILLCTLLALWLLWWLTAQLYGRRVGWGALVVALLLSGHPQLNPIIMGRQVYAEMPQFAALLGGCATLLLALRGRWGWALLAALLFALALEIKLQTVPFWLVGMVGTLLVLAVLRRWNAVGMLAAVAVGAWLGRTLLQTLQLSILAGRAPQGDAISGLLEVTAVVPSWFNRQFAFTIILLFALPTLLGLLHAMRRVWHERRTLQATRADEAAFALRTLLLLMAGSWYAWFALLSVGVPRYLFPATFLASGLTAAWLFDATRGYGLVATLDRVRALVRRATPDAPVRRGDGLAALGTLLLITVALTFTLLGVSRYYPGNDQAVYQTANFLNTQTPPNARIETYESELHFLLERPYHFPPDQLHVTLNRRSLLGEDVSIAYDPLAADPDYLVVGTFAAENNLYAPWIARGTFREVATFGRYTVYARVRS